MNAEVSKRCEVLLVDGIPKPQFGCDSAVEMTENVKTICALGCGREPKQFYWRQVLEQRLVRRCSRVMKLIHNHDVELGRFDVADVSAVQTLDRREDVFEVLRPLAADPFLAKCWVA